MSSRRLGFSLESERQRGASGEGSPRALTAHLKMAKTKKPGAVKQLIGGQSHAITIPKPAPLPTERQAKYVANRIAGMNKTKAAIAAGYSPKTADTMGAQIERTAGVRASFQELLRSAIPQELITQRLQEGVNATAKTYFQKAGEVTDEREDPDYATRHKYLETVVKLGDLYVDALRLQGADGGDLPQTPLAVNLSLDFVNQTGSPVTPPTKDKRRGKS